jgi:hypothetical protein
LGALACIGLMASVGCASDGGPDNTLATQSAAVKQASPPCSLTGQGTLWQQHLDVVAPPGPGGPAHLVADEVFDLSTQPFKSITETGTIEIGGSVVYSYTKVIAPQGTMHFVIDWGPHVKGAKHAVFDIANNIVSGSIDGRTFVPFPLGTDPATVQFTDGGPSPLLKSAPPLDDALSRLSKAVGDALAMCGPSAGSPQPVGPTTDSQPGHVTLSQCVSGTSGPFCCLTATSTPCGNQCCPGQGTCINGACCDPNQACGSTCCPSGQICVLGQCTADTLQCDQATYKCTQPGFAPVCCLHATTCGQGQCCFVGEIRDSCGQCATEDCIH